MLTTTDLQHCLRIRSLFCTLKLLPLKVDHEAGRFYRLKSNWSLGLCVFNYFHYLLRVCFINYRLFTAIIQHEYEKDELHLLSWDVVTLFGGNLNALWYAILFVQKPDITVYILNQAFSIDNKSSKFNLLDFTSH